MNQSETIHSLGRLLHILCRSLPMYLRDAKPWTRRDDDRAQQVLADLVADEEIFSRRIAQAILDRDGRPDPGRFPDEFTSINDVSLGFLTPTVIEYQQRDVKAIEQCVAELADEPSLRSLGEELTAAARKHLKLLEELPSTEEAGRS